MERSDWPVSRRAILNRWLGFLATDGPGASSGNWTSDFSSFHIIFIHRNSYKQSPFVRELTTRAHPTTSRPKYDQAHPQPHPRDHLANPAARRPRVVFAAPASASHAASRHSPTSSSSSSAQPDTDSLRARHPRLERDTTHSRLSSLLHYCRSCCLRSLRELARDTFDTRSVRTASEHIQLASLRHKKVPPCFFVLLDKETGSTVKVIFDQIG